MIRREGRRIVLSGPVTLANVGALFEEGRRHIDEGVSLVDLADVAELDSSLLAMLLAWLREAKSRGHELAFVNLPAALSTIARLYGVEGLLPLAGAH
jgi:phospholipid transport system transporter-binding protein